MAVGNLKIDFLNQNISFHNCVISMKFHMPNENIHLDGKRKPDNRTLG